jgi:hypothetical protein
MSVYCLIIGHDGEVLFDPFDIHCDPGLKIAGLKTKVVEARSALAGIDPATLSVYHSSPLNAEMNIYEWRMLFPNLIFAKQGLGQLNLWRK